MAPLLETCLRGKVTWPSRFPSSLRTLMRLSTKATADFSDRAGFLLDLYGSPLRTTSLCEEHFA